MLTKANKILIGMLIVQLALVFVVHLTGGRDRATEVALVPGFDASAVTRVQVESKGAKLDIVKRGDSWVVASAFDYPTTATRVTDAIAPLGKIQIGEPMATSPSRHTQLEVADREFAKKITITQGGKDTVIFIGGPAGLRRSAVRIGGSDEVYAAEMPTLIASAEPRDWVDHAYAVTPVADVTRVEIKQPGHAVTLAKQGAAWTAMIDGTAPPLAKGESLDTSAIESIVSAVSSIDLQAPADPKRAIATPTVITVATAKSTTAFDVVADGERYWVKKQGDAHAVLVNKSQLAAAVEASAATLVKKPAPPPEPVPSGLPPGFEVP